MNQEENKLILPEDNIYDIVRKHPEIKERLLKLSPKYARLNNPVIFNTVAKVTTAKKAASVGGIYWQEFVYQLNDAIGLGKEYLEESKKEAFAAHGAATPAKNEKGPQEKPEWLDKTSGFEIMDVREGGEPFFKVTEKAKTITSGSGFILVQKFEPLPLVSYLETLGFEHYTEKKNDLECRIIFYKR